MVQLHKLHDWEISIIPWCYVLAAAILGFFIPRVSYTILPRLQYPISEITSITFLSAVAMGMMALTALVFSFLYIAITFGSTAYSPRLVGAFASDKFAHTVGIFAGTFMYALLVLLVEGVGSGSEGISTLTLLVAIAWMLSSLYVLFRLLRQSWQITITRVLYALGQTGEQEITRVYSPDANTADVAVRDIETPVALHPITQCIIYRGLPQYLLALDIVRLVSLAQAADAVIRVPFAIGDTVMDDEALATVHGTGGVIAEKSLRRAIMLGQECTIEYNPMFALRLLVDIAIRALSPAINDPTTAVQSLNQIEALLLRLGKANLDIGHVRDGAGALRLVYVTPKWEDYLTLGVLEIQQYGAGSVQVQRRIGALLHTLSGSLPESRRPAIAQFAAERLTLIRRTFPDSLYRSEAEGIDRRGLGHIETDGMS